MPVLLVLLGSVLVRSFDLDLKLARWFWSEAAGWWLKDLPAVKFAYRFGSIPCVVAASVAFVLWLASFWIRRLRLARKFALFMSLSLLLGPVLVVNIALKAHYGRPRPREVAEFGGGKTFREVGQGAFTGTNTSRSFPSGHAAAAYFWFAPAIYFRRRLRALARAFVLLALVHGGLMSAARMAQGAHWLSDTLWSAAFVYMAAYIVWHILSRVRHPFVQSNERTMVGMPRCGVPARVPAGGTVRNPSAFSMSYVCAAGTRRGAGFGD